MSNPYRDSHYAHERVGYGLQCETAHEDIKEGDVVKCVHCHEDYEVMTDFPKPCIERIALALEEARRG